jgi:steroid delta-isomerase-like uncharacterized protein
MKFLLFLSFWASLMVPAATRAQSSSTTSRIARAWLDDLNRRDTLALAALYADTARLYSPNWEGAETGPAGVRGIYRRYFSSTPDLQHEMTHLIATDSSLVIEYTFRGTLSNPEGATPAYMKGKKYELQAITRMDLRGGKIAGQVSYFDQVAFLRQMGFFDQLGK